MRLSVAFFVAVALGCVSESSSVFGPSPRIREEQLGRGIMFLCGLWPTVYCDGILASLPPGATNTDAAAAIFNVVTHLKRPENGGVLSQKPIPRNRITPDALGDGYDLICRSIPALDCRGIIQRLPPYATESDAASAILQRYASFRLPAPNSFPPVVGPILLWLWCVSAWHRAVCGSISFY